MDAVALPPRLVEDMLDLARAAAQLEVCGLIASKNGAPVRCIAISNIAEDPRQRFAMDPKQQIDAFRSMRENGEDLFAIWHSHPDGPAFPSATDLREAGYPEVVQVIVSPGAAPPLRCFRFVEGRPVELELSLQ